MEKTNYSSEEKKWMFRMTSTLMGVTSLVMIALFFLLLNASSSISNRPYDKTSINVSGVAERMVKPDIATISFSVTEKGSNQSVAQDAVSKTIKKINLMLEEEGIDEADIQTSGVSVYPIYKEVEIAVGAYCDYDRMGYCPPPPYPYESVEDGYEVSQTTTVKIRDIEKAGEIVASLSESGVKNLYGPSLTVDNYEELIEEVKIEAIADARNKAEARAKALGMKLGEVMSISEDYYQPYGMYDGYGKGGGMGMEVMSLSSAMPTEISAGETEIRASISVSYELR